MGRGALAAAVTLSGLMACSGTASNNGPVDRQHGIPIRASEIHGPGTRMGDGFTVPPGAVLAGPVLSTTNRANTGHVRTWSATLGIDGPPIDVMQQLANQAHAKGLTLAPEGPVCSSTPRVPVSQPRFCRYTSTPIVRGQPTAIQSFSVEVQQTDAPTTIGFVAYQDLAAGPEIVFQADHPTVAAPDLMLAPLPAQHGAARGRLPQEGEEIAPGIPMLPNTTAVTPVFRSWRGQTEAVLRVTDEPDAVFRRYVHLLRDLYGGLTRSPTNRSGPWKVNYASFEEGIEDGAGGTLHLFTAGHRAYIRLELHPSA